MPVDQNLPLTRYPADDSESSQEQDGTRHPDKLADASPDARRLRPMTQLAWLQIGLLVALLSVIVLALMRWRDRSAHARKRWLEEQLAARTAELLRTAQALAEAGQRIQDLSSRDGLTGLLNRRQLLDHAPEGPGRSSCVLIDMDHFKDINDRHGQQVGDRVLTAFASQLAQSVIGADQISGRYGGDAFLVFLKDQDRFMAAHWADQLRLQWAGTLLTLEGGQALRCTSSFGVAERESGEPLDAWIARADGALYTAKHRGRDRVEIAG